MRQVQALVLMATLSVSPSFADDFRRAHPFTGRVIDALGAPVADAEVWLGVPNVGSDKLVVESTRTDAKGQFRLTVPSDWTETMQTYRQELSVLASQEGRWAAVQYSRDSVPPAEGLVLTLAEPGESRLRILSPAGKPVQGATVTVLGLLAEQFQEVWTNDEKTTQDGSGAKKAPSRYFVRQGIAPLPEGRALVAGPSDGDGYVMVRGLGLGRIAGVKVASAAFGDQHFFVNPTHDRQQGARTFPGTLTLKPTGRITGQLRGGDTSAISGIDLHLTSSVPLGLEPLWVNGTAKVRTDAEGKFEVPALSARASRLFPGAGVEVALRAGVPGRVSKSPGRQGADAGDRDEAKSPREGGGAGCVDARTDPRRGRAYLLVGRLCPRNQRRQGTHQRADGAGHRLDAPQRARRLRRGSTRSSSQA